jgi:AraC-like DNA-binding protein
LQERDTGAVRPTTERDSRELDGAWTQHQEHAEAAPAEDLAAFVETYWLVRWRYDTPYHQKVVPLVHLHLTLGSAVGPRLHGVATGFVVRELAGSGWATGAVLRPGVARCLLDEPVGALTDRIVEPTRLRGWTDRGVDLVGAAAERFAAPGSRSGPDGVFDAWDRWWRPVLAGRSLAPPARQASAAVTAALGDASLRRVDELAARTGMPVRRLQRLFAEHVGVGPKWVLRRARLQDVTLALAVGRSVGWADLAADLGYTDQAHLSRDFAAIFGEPPTAYGRRYPPP